MFHQLLPTYPRKALPLSIVVHSAILYLVITAGPRFIQPSSIAFGNQGRGLSMEVLYLGPSYAPANTPLTAPKSKDRPSRKTHVSAPHPVMELSAVESARAGSLIGSALTGPRTGYESRPALPVVFPNPAVDRSDIPSGVAGDVVVEVTIDENGNVAETKVLESLGYGLEGKVLEALKNWRFIPATMNGVAIASRQDVHFHFPS